MEPTDRKGARAGVGFSADVATVLALALHAASYGEWIIDDAGISFGVRPSPRRRAWTRRPDRRSAARRLHERALDPPPRTRDRPRHLRHGLAPESAGRHLWRARSDRHPAHSDPDRPCCETLDRGGNAPHRGQPGLRDLDSLRPRERHDRPAHRRPVLLRLGTAVAPLRGPERVSRRAHVLEPARRRVVRARVPAAGAADARRAATRQTQVRRNQRRRRGNRHRDRHELAVRLVRGLRSQHVPRQGRRHDGAGGVGRAGHDPGRRVVHVWRRSRSTARSGTRHLVDRRCSRAHRPTRRRRAATRGRPSVRGAARGSRGLRRHPPALTRARPGRTDPDRARPAAVPRAAARLDARVSFRDPSSDARLADSRRNTRWSRAETSRDEPRAARGVARGDGRRAPDHARVLPALGEVPGRPHGPLRSVASRTSSNASSCGLGCSQPPTSRLRR